MEQLRTHPTLHEPETLATLRTLCFLPATQGLPDSPTAQVLAAPDACVLARDWQLGWAALPVLTEQGAPPASIHTVLGLRSPPVFDTIAMHLKQVVWAGVGLIACFVRLCERSAVLYNAHVGAWYPYHVNVMLMHCQFRTPSC